MGSLFEQFWDARFPPRDPVHLSYKDKAVLVTGANTGLGFEAAVKFAQLGASTLILGVRSLQKGEKAKESILSRTQCSANIVVVAVDLSTFASVRDFANRVSQITPQLNVVLLCAGIMNPAFVVGEEGYEESLQVNVLSTAFMACLLLPRLKEAAYSLETSDHVPHMCFVNSLACQWVKSEWIPDEQTLIGRINDVSQFDHAIQYFLVKLAAKFYADELRERCEEHGIKIIINMCCPRMCWTDIHRRYSLPIRMTLWPYKVLCGRSAEQGSRTLVSATGLGPDCPGGLWSNDKLDPPAGIQATERGLAMKRQTYQEIMAILREKVGFEGL